MGPDYNEKQKTSISVLIEIQKFVVTEIVKSTRSYNKSNGVKKT